MSKKPSQTKRAITPSDMVSTPQAATPDIVEFGDVLAMIDQARTKTFKAVNRELISLYWEIGRFVSEKVREQGWGKSVVAELSKTIQANYAGIRGFSPQNIWRMRQFYETYRENEKLSPVVREITWTNHLLILPNKTVLQNKLRELTALAEEENED